MYKIVIVFLSLCIQNKILVIKQKHKRINVKHSFALNSKKLMLIDSMKCIKLHYNTLSSIGILDSSSFLLS